MNQPQAAQPRIDENGTAWTIPPEMEAWLKAHVDVESAKHADAGGKEYDKAMRIELCGNAIWTSNPVTGKVYQYQAECKIWRECDRCFKLRKDRFQERYERAEFQVEKVGVVRLTKEETKLIIRHFRHRDILYWRIPVKTGIVLMFDENKATREVGLKGEDTELDWDELAQTPYRMRYTGKLGKEESIPREDPGEVIYVQVLKIGRIAGLDDRLIQACANAANQVFTSAPEFNKVSIESACNGRMQMFKKKIKEMGGTIGFQQRINVKVSQRFFSGSLAKQEEKRNEMTSSTAAQDAFNASTTPPRHTIDELFAPQ